MAEYEVTWGMICDADSPEEAVRQALGWLAEVAKPAPTGPTIFLVRNTDLPQEQQSWITVDAEELPAEPVTLN